jgi:hypothetical protein
MHGASGPGPNAGLVCRLSGRLVAAPEDRIGSHGHLWPDELDTVSEGLDALRRAR